MPSWPKEVIRVWNLNAYENALAPVACKVGTRLVTDWKHLRTSRFIQYVVLGPYRVTCLIDVLYIYTYVYTYSLEATGLGVQYDWCIFMNFHVLQRQMGRCPILALRIFPSARSFGNRWKPSCLKDAEPQFHASPLRSSPPHFCHVIFFLKSGLQMDGLWRIMP